MPKHSGKALAAALVVAMLLSSDQAGATGHAIFHALSAATHLNRVATHGDQEQISWVLQKVVHVALFGAIGVLAGRTGPAATRRKVLAMSIGAGIVTEALQLWTKSRSAEMRDVVINAASICAGYFTRKSENDT